MEAHGDGVSLDGFSLHRQVLPSTLGVFLESHTSSTLVGGEPPTNNAHQRNMELRQ